MSDNVPVNPGTRSNAITVATDEIDDVHYPIYKLSQGVDGEQIPVSEDDPLPTAASSQDIIRGYQMQETMDNVLVQLKILNAYMAEGSDEIITEDDIS